MQDQKPMPDAPPLPRSRGGRPKSEPGTVRARTIGVRVNPSESALLDSKAAAMGITAGDFLRQAGLTRRLPSSPVPAINRQEYADLARLASNLNQLAHQANSGAPVAVNDALLHQVAGEVRRLRQALLGLESSNDSERS
jgi:hypothetical protein